ncbi:hypothetical protein DFQ30_011214 [Apophysomyces sp. BC1015]|nr:hypothetical protein DFQ30_011214 [Apophysomyces sp. BC1015]
MFNTYRETASYNRSMSEELEVKLKEHNIAQASLVYLKSFPTALELIMDALDKSVLSLSAFLWTYKVEAEMDEEQLIKIMQFVLTDWAGKCNRPLIYRPKSERNFWIDRSIPIFQSIGDQTSLVGFEWCKTNPTSHTESAMQQDSWKCGPLRNVDGLERNEHGAEIIVMEGSSGQTNEDIAHTTDDTLQNIHGSICTLCSTTATLDSRHPGQYTHQECRTAEIPLDHSQRLDWLKVFELVAYLVTMLREQILVVLPIAKGKLWY